MEVRVRTSRVRPRNRSRVSGIVESDFSRRYFRRFEAKIFSASARVLEDRLLERLTSLVNDPHDPQVTSVHLTAEEGALPLLSVVLMVDRQRQRGERCLASLLKQSIISKMEIILIDFAGPSEVPLPGASHEKVRLVRLRRGMRYGDAKAVGFLAARGKYAGFFEEHCLADSGWAEEIVEGFSFGAVAVSGEIRN